MWRNVLMASDGVHHLYVGQFHLLPGMSTYLAQSGVVWSYRQNWPVNWIGWWLWSWLLGWGVLTVQEPRRLSRPLRSISWVRLTTWRYFESTNTPWKVANVSVIHTSVIIALIRPKMGNVQLQRNWACKKMVVGRKRWWFVWEKTSLNGTWRFRVGRAGRRGVWAGMGKTRLASQLGSGLHQGHWALRIISMLPWDVFGAKECQSCHGRTHTEDNHIRTYSGSAWVPQPCSECSW